MNRQRDTQVFELAPRQYHLADDGVFPNSALPLLVYPSAVDSVGTVAAAVFERLFTANGWPAC